MGCVVFSAVFCVDVSPTPRVGVPCFPCMGAGGRDLVQFMRRQVQAAVARLGGCAPPGRSAWWLGVAVPLEGCAVSTRQGDRAVLGLPVWRAPPSWCASWCSSLRPLSQCHGPWPFLFPVLVMLRCFLAPVLHCSRCPVPVGTCLLPWASPRLFAAGLPFALSLPGVLVVW